MELTWEPGRGTERKNHHDECVTSDCGERVYERNRGPRASVLKGLGLQGGLLRGGGAETLMRG